MSQKNQFEGFTAEEAVTVVDVFVCAQCEGALTAVPQDDDVWMVICPDCGNVEQVGRISKTTVAIREERGIFAFSRVIRKLPELWGELIPTKEELGRNLKELGF